MAIEQEIGAANRRRQVDRSVEQHPSLGQTGHRESVPGRDDLVVPGRLRSPTARGEQPTTHIHPARRIFRVRRQLQSGRAMLERSFGRNGEQGFGGRRVGPEHVA